MRAQEFIFEGKRKKISKTFDHSSPGIDAYDTGSDPYPKYRIGIAAAGAPDFEHDFNPEGPMAADMITSLYTTADEEIMNAAHKKAGVKRKKIVKPGSMELPGTNTVSPVSNWNKK